MRYGRRPCGHPAQKRERLFRVSVDVLRPVFEANCMQAPCLFFGSLSAENPERLEIADDDYNRIKTGESRRAASISQAIDFQAALACDAFSGTCCISGSTPWRQLHSQRYTTLVTYCSVSSETA